MSDRAVVTAPLRRRLLVLAALVGVVMVVTASDLLHAPVAAAIEVVRRAMERHPISGALLFVAASALSAMLAFVSSAVLVPSAVLLWGAPAATALLWTGWLLGGLAAYGIGARIGRPLLRRLVPTTTADSLAGVLHARTPFGIVLLMQLALPSELPGYLLGTAGCPLVRYLGALALAELPYAAGTVLVGEGLVTRRLGLLLGAGAAAALASVAAVTLLRRRLAQP